MAGKLHVNLMLLMIFLGFFRGVLAVVDFTSVTAYGSLQERPYVFIASYLVLDDDATADNNDELVFSRVMETGSVDDLTGWTDVVDWLPNTLSKNVKRKMFQIPSHKAKSVGVFQWTYSSNAVTTILMKSKASLLPTFVSRTVNLGDDVHLTVTRNTNNSNFTNTKWRKGGTFLMKDTLLKIDINNASTSDSGIYECHYLHERDKGNQALIRLIVRGCQKNKFDSKKCNRNCRSCRNGGVCDDVNGECICPPGFSGNVCLKIKGPNHFGQDGSLRCDSVGLPSTGPTCRGMLFCLPDPYGCSCAAGYTGLFCNKDCKDGTYGANCAQTCHCADGVPCNGTTGRCKGKCAPGYTGKNCQICVSGMFGPNCSQTCHCADGVTCDGETGRCPGGCAPTYTGHSCQEPCADGTFGDNCAQCHCATEASCDRLTGHCDGHCAPGYIGDTCQEKCLHFRNTPSCNTTCLKLAHTVKPQRLTVSLSSGGGLFTHTLSWDPVNCPTNEVNIVNYVYKLLPAYESDVQPVAVEGTSVHLNLSFCTKYQFKVAARTSNGTGPYSMALNYTTRSTVPNPVTINVVSRINHAQLTLSWDAAVTNPHNRCPATDYLVTFELIHLDQCLRVSNNIERFNTTNTTIIIGKLKAYSTYRVNVTSRNDVGSSTPVTKSTTTGQSKPDAPTVVVNSTSSESITFVWDLPCGSRGGNITKYQYKYRNQTGSWNPSVKHFITNYVTLTSLTPCTMYVFYVRAWTIVEGPWSKRARQQTKAQAPSGVTHLAIQPYDHDKLKVFWKANDGIKNNPCLAADYLVTYELTNLDQCQEGDHSGGSLTTSNTSISIEGLKAYSTYRVNVTSRNEAGNGTTIFSSNVTGEKEPTYAPTVYVNSSAARHIKLVWDIPCGGRGGNITTYQYRYWTENERHSSEKASQTKDSCVSLTSLSPCVSYLFQVRASTKDGFGPWSNETMQRTQTQAPSGVKRLTIQPYGHDKLNVSWRTKDDIQKNRCLATDYLVTYELINLERCQEVDKSSRSLITTNTSFLIEGLEAYSKYRIYVTSRNEAGNGTTKTSSKTTGEKTPSGPPSDLKSTDVTNHTMTFSWNQPECGQRNGNITQYHYTLDSSEEKVVREDTVSDTRVDFTGLVPFALYTLSVSAQNQFASGPVASNTTRTKEGIPPSPSDVAFPVTRSEQITVEWHRPNPPHGIIISYEILYWKTDSETSSSAKTVRITEQLSGRYQKNTITDLEGSLSYSIKIRAETSVGYGQWSNISTATTAPGEPSQPQSLIATKVTLTSITLTWKQPQYPNGEIVKYVVEHRVLTRPYDSSFNFDRHSSIIKRQEVAAKSPSTLIVLADLEPCTQYEVKVWAVNDADITGQNETKLEVYTELPTDLPPPDKPALIGEESTATSLTIRLVSTSTSKYISSYQIGVRNIDGDSTATGKISKRSVPGFQHHALNPSAYVAAELLGKLPGKFVVGDNKTHGNYWNPPLQEGAVYEIYVGTVSRINETRASVNWNEEPLIVEVDGDYSEPNAAASVVAVILVLLVIVVAALLIIVILRKWKEGKTSDEQDDLNAASSNPPDYEDIELQKCSSASADQVSRSSADQSSESGNTPDPSTGTNSAEQSNGGPSTSTKPTIKQKVNLRSKSANKGASASSASSTGPVAMTELARFIKTRKSGKINAFQQDFETLPSAPNHPQTVALCDANRKKNRYKNISAYDHSRVVLEKLEGKPHSDYINACYIDGYKCEAKYIACQGPNQTTVCDMWRMVWQERVGKIIMLANLVENGKDKCEKYWPDDEAFTYGDIFVRQVEEKADATFIVRTFYLSKSSEPEGEYREVLQYHYITWPDMKPPESSSLLRFIGRVHASETTQHGPTIVHCSAGVGRTGTYIALDAMLEQAQAEGHVDVLNFVRNMRDKRYLMVQTVDQFKFIYEALLESSLSENTAIPVDRFQQDHAKLKKRDKKTGTNGIEDQFQMLDTFTASLSDDQCYGGRQPDNADKNRFEDCIPRDSTRPYLMTTGDEGSTNYINATFLEGSRGKHSYLATQAPLPTTVGDIWRLVFDYKSTCIVMLNSMDNKPTIPKYWPEDDSMNFGPLTVTLLSVDQRNEDMIVRQFGILYPLRNNEEVHTVCHIQFLQWPTKKDVPNSPSSLLKLLETVKMWTEEHPDGPLTVHCIDGEGCSGTFCALVTLLDRMEKDGIIDVFQAVKKLRSTRAGMVKTLTQYQLCYQVIKSYLDLASSSSIYENFSR